MTVILDKFIFKGIAESFSFILGPEDCFCECYTIESRKNYKKLEKQGCKRLPKLPIHNNNIFVIPHCYYNQVINSSKANRISSLTHTENDFPIPTRICLSEEDFQLEIGPREFPPIEGGIFAWYNVASR